MALLQATSPEVDFPWVSTCPVCGTFREPADHFCRRCGSALAVSAPPAVPDVPPAPAPPTPGLPPATGPRPPQVPSPAPPMRWAGAPPPAPRERRRVLPALLGLVSLLGLVVSGVGARTMLTADQGAVTHSGGSVTGQVGGGTVTAPPTGPASGSSTVPATPGTSAVPAGGGATSSPAGERPGASGSGGSVATATTARDGTWHSCANYALGYRISYPPGYRTAVPNDRLACRFFDTEPFTVTTDSPLPPRQIRISAGEGTYEDLSRDYTPAPGSAVIDRAAVSVDGHRGFEMEIRATTGKLAHVYVVDAGGLALVLDTYEGHCSDYAATKAVLASMVGSLVFLSGDAG